MTGRAQNPYPLVEPVAGAVIEPADFRAAQRGVLIRGVMTLLFCAGVLAAGWLLSPRWFATDPDVATRWRLAAVGWLAVGLCLAQAIQSVSIRRLLAARDIGGSIATDSSDDIRLHRAILQNTLEQAVLAFIAYAALAIALPGVRLAIIPTLALLFVTGRALFARGLGRGAVARAAGFVMTFAPSVAGLLLAAALLLTGGPAT